MKLFFASIEEVPEHLRKDAVKQDDGSYILEGEGAAGILNKNAELLTKNKQLQAIADKFKGLPENADAATIKKALADLEQASAREQEIQDRIQAAVRESAKQFQSQIETANTTSARMKASLEKQIIDTALTTAVVNEKGDPFFVLPTLRNQVKTVEVNGEFVARVVDEKGNVRFGANGDPMTIGELVAGAKKDKQYARVFEAPAASGSGAQGDAGGAGAQGAPGTVRLSREQAKDASKYQAALASVKGDYSKIEVVEG